MMRHDTITLPSLFFKSNISDTKSFETSPPYGNNILNKFFIQN